MNTDLVRGVCLAVTVAAWGCAKVTAQSDAGVGTSGTGGGRGSGTGGAQGDGGPDRAAPPTMDASSLVDSGEDAACAARSVEAELVPLDLTVMVDSSRSMLEATSSGPSKWDAVRSGLGAFFNDPQSAGIFIGLGYFPQVRPSAAASCSADGACGEYGPCERRRACVRTGTSGIVDTSTVLCGDSTACAANESCELIGQCPGQIPCAPAGTTCGSYQNCPAFEGYCRNRDICETEPYATPAVPVAALPGAVGALTASLAARMPDGFTPTGPALRGAIAHAQARARSNPNHKPAVLLVTDGLPGGFIPGMPNPACTPADVAGVAEIARAAAMATPPVPTFVIGVFDARTAATALANLNTLAQAAGTGAAVVINTGQNVSSELQTALSQIRTKAFACEYKIPAPMGGAIDFNKVNVQFTSGAGVASTVGYARAQSGCHATRGGWYYDADPAGGTAPTAIVTCPATCQQLQTDTTGRVDIVLGCQTIVVE